MALWHDLRLRATALAADAPPTEEALALLRRYVAYRRRSLLRRRKDAEPERRGQAAT